MKNICHNNKLELGKHRIGMYMCLNTNHLTLPLNEGLCQQEGDIRDIYVIVRGLGAGDTPMVNVYQDQAICFLEDRGQSEHLSLHTPLKTYKCICIH